MKRNTKEQRTREGILLRALQQAGADSFLVNVIQCHHSNPMRKLRGLLALVQAGKSVHVGQFDLDVLLVDGGRENWTLLDVGGTPGEVLR